MRRKKEQKMLCSVHAKSFKTLQKLSFLLTYTTQLMRCLNCLVSVATDLRQPHVYQLPEYHIYESFQGVDEEY